MVCGGFACSRNALCALNVVYVLVALLLIAVAAWGRGFAGAPGAPLTGGAIAVGVALLLLALLGLLGAARHHQVLLFFHDHPGAGVPGAVRGLLLLFGHRPQPPGAAVQLGLAHPEQRDARGAGAAPGLLRAAQPQRPPRRAGALPRRMPEPPRRALPDLRRPDAAALGRGAQDPGGGRLVLQLHRDPGGVVGHALPQPEGPARQPQRLPIAGGVPSLLGGSLPSWVLSLLGVRDPPATSPSS